MTPSLVQSKCTASLSNGQGEAFTSPVTAGNTLLAACLAGSNSVSGFSIEDDLNGVWTPVPASKVGSGPTEITQWFILPSSVGGTPTVSLGLVGLYSAFIALHEFSGLDGTVDVVATTTTTNASYPSCPITTLTDGDLVIASVITSMWWVGEPSGWALAVDIGGAHTMYEVAASAGVVSPPPGSTVAHDSSVISAVALKSGGAPPPPPPPPSYVGAIRLLGV